VKGCIRYIRLFSRDWSTLGCLVYVLVLISLSLSAPLITPYSPNAVRIDAMFQSPCQEHFFGTDNYGRDIFTRIVYGLGITLRVGFLVMAFTAVAGATIAAITSFSKVLDTIVMRIMDILMAFPVIILALVLIAMFGTSEQNIVLALIIVYTPRMVRLVRSEMLKVEGEVFIESAKALGASKLRIAVRHILPNCLSPWLVQATFIFVYAILSDAALSFLGLGTPPPAPTLGNIISEGRAYITYAPWISLIPGVVIASIVVTLSVIGDRIRDIADPKFLTWRSVSRKT